MIDLIKNPNKPPLGVVPKGLFFRLRKKDLIRAIQEYTDQGLEVNPEWIKELEEYK